MRKAVDDEIERGATEFIILDYPFGRDHRRFETLIDLSVFVDTPLDVAMARRITRDYRAAAGESADEVLERLHAELAHYVEKARYPYLDTDRHKPGSDLILNGWRSVLELRDEVLDRVKVEDKWRRGVFQWMKSKTRNHSVQSTEVYMSVRRTIVLAALWLASLIVVSTWTAAQAPQARNDATVYSGENFGFRVSSPGGKEGVLVVRINGQWVEAQLSARVSPVKKH